MPNIDVLRDVFDKAGRLEAVWEARLNSKLSFITELKLCFEKLSLVVTADGESDTVILRTGDFSNDPDVTHIDVSADVLWSQLQYLGMRWAWELRNHQGYCDGVRFEFSDLETDVSLEVEVIVAASMLQIYRCEPVSRQLPNPPLQPTSGR